MELISAIILLFCLFVFLYVRCDKIQTRIDEIIEEQESTNKTIVNMYNVLNKEIHRLKNTKQSEIRANYNMDFTHINTDI